jgi:NADH:ubiquinone oxidoreductase subunit 6 (subunit J)
MRFINLGRCCQVCRQESVVLYIVAIGWLYVVLMMALAERSFAAGASTFLLYGVLPLSVVLYLLATPARRRAQKARQQAQTLPGNESTAPPDDRA